MNKEKLLIRFGLTGTIIAALCCFTPVLVLLFSALGLSALTGYLDMVLLPSLAIFIGITLYALYRKKQSDAKDCCNPKSNAGDTHE